MYDLLFTEKATKNLKKLPKAVLMHPAKNS